MYEIDYKIYGEELQFVEGRLGPNETAVQKAAYDGGWYYDTEVFLAMVPQQSNSLLDKLFSAEQVGESYLWQRSNIGLANAKSVAAPSGDYLGLAAW